MPPNFFSKVAPEIWVIILEFIDPVEEREDLQSASLSCRTLAYPGQYILFRYLKLSGDQHLQSMPLGSADKYARCARHLCIRDFHGSKRSSWPGPLDNLVQILSLCSGLVDISIRSYYEASETAGIPRSSRGSLLSVSRRRETEPLFRSLSSVHTITIDENTATRTVDYPYFLNCFPQLQKLIAIDLTHGTPLISGNDAFPAFSLDSLSLMYVYDMPFLNWLSPALGDLKYLSITRGTAFEITGDDFNGHEFIITSGHILDTFKLWLRGIGQSVVHLTLDVSDSARWELVNQDEFLFLAFLTPGIRVLNVNGLRISSYLLVKQATDILLQMRPALKFLEHIVFDDEYVLRPDDIGKEIVWSRVLRLVS